MAKEYFSPKEIGQITSSAVLSDLGILLERERRRIVIEPFRGERLSTSSYDLSLGEYYFVRQRLESGMLSIYDPETIGKIWGKSQRGRLAKEIKEKRYGGRDLWQGISDEDRLIMVPPGGVLLVHSEEFAGAKEGYKTMVRSRSTLERLGVTIAISAGMGDVGFVNRWSFLLTNEHTVNEVPLKVGMPFAQIVFLKCRPVEKDYVERGGQYQETNDFAELASSWKPENMLPKVPK